MAQSAPAVRSFGYAWAALCLAFAIHVTDESLTGFLAVYNPTVLAVRARHHWFPMPTFDFRAWLFGLIALNLFLLLLTPFAFRNARPLRWAAYPLAAIMFLNGLGHISATILGRTVSSVHFVRPAPGFYSSPILLVASFYLFSALRRSVPPR